MYDEPEETPTERSLTPSDQAKEKADEFRVHAQLAAVFEAGRKFGAQIITDLNPDLARDIQQTIGRLEKSRSADSPLLPEASAADAARLLNLPQTRELSTNDYHIRRRPGEVVIVRWLAGEQVDTFYTRLQAHFDVAINHFRDEEHQSKEWKQDPKTLEYLKALDAINLKMADIYLRPIIKEHKIFVLSTQTADEMDILHLAGYVMGASPEELVGEASAPPEAPTEQDRAWFFKLYSLRGMHDGEEQMCFFTFLQKTDEMF